MKDVVKKILKLGLWHSLDVQFADVLALPIYDDNNIKEALILASATLSANVRIGHVCLPLCFLTPDKLFQGNYPELTNTICRKLGKLSITDWQELLLSCPAVSDGSRVTPLILENKNLYLHHMWRDECIVAQFFNHKYQSNIFQKEKIIYVLNQLFPVSYTEIDWHKIATAIGITHHRVLISGGPGTGKTSIIAKIIAALLLCNNNNNLNIKITAPTGKAAALLTESFKTTINNIPQLKQYSLRNLPEKATTLHSLLRTLLYTEEMQYNYFNFSNLDLVVIDEASMVSLSILAQLILRLSPQTNVILFGDQHQLCSVEPGSVFKDVCQFSNFFYSPERHQELIDLTGYTLPVVSPSESSMHYNYNSIIDGTCILKKNYRFSESSGIHQLSSAINAGDYIKTLSLLNSNIYKDLYYICFVDKKSYITMILNCAMKYSNYFKKLKHTKILTKNILEIFSYYRILCASRDGPFGVIRLNYYVEQILNEKGLIQLNNSRNYIGRPIIILRNKPSLELYNGDVGVLLLNDQNKLSAYFISSQGGIKVIQIYQLPEHETCFAMTIHKAQGSEFQHISIVLSDRHTPLLTRELFYTAVTRARQYLCLYATDHVIISSVNLPTQRYSGLYNKIKNNIMSMV
ncbi:exodeoxyribonuclease V subunit alpha [Blochmannia endosymbiont of Camponotus sp. C-003]|uniref:exodeoxyribonuclease V subunit alpha n=1 Tax=unclassified Candidatus Blochmanniella TaxID=711328 RepID=UPI00202582A5|nr:MULTISPECIES: exodeoxyribonuclease V subunit alpha [unclassified Candidatus Blochmannia]URJ23540.1 exodeoxyribonuclease V subunit alpha [Blochmannia endosymbiont of Camponotus sp. C-003]URJ29011.1 exodeoxyribonuclease V subunit alpha [Blochmannia endosymbiont of Camponotus sp. C-046]